MQWCLLSWIPSPSHFLLPVWTSWRRGVASPRRCNRESRFRPLEPSAARPASRAPSEALNKQTHTHHTGDWQREYTLAFIYYFFFFKFVLFSFNHSYTAFTPFISFLFFWELLSVFPDTAQNAACELWLDVVLHVKKCPSGRAGSLFWQNTLVKRSTRD